MKISLATSAPSQIETECLAVTVIDTGDKKPAPGVLSSDPANTTALVNLGAIYGAAGRTSEAAALWQRALETNPALESAALNLSRVLPRAGARAVVERYLSFNPGSKAARERLESLARP